MKIRVTVSEKLTYRHEIIIEQDDSMNDEQLERILEKVERECSFDANFYDIVQSLKRHGVKVIETIENDSSSPWESEVEIYDVSEIADEK